MTKIDLKYIARDRDRHGNVRFYYRRPGRAKIRLRGSPGTQEFLTAYENAQHAHPEPDKAAAGHTLDWLCERFYKSDYFKGLDGETQARKRRDLDKCREIKFEEARVSLRVGTLPFARITPAAIRKLCDLLSSPDMANQRRKHFSSLYKWAVKEKQPGVKENPCQFVGKREIVNKDGFYTWTEDDLEKFEKRWPIGTREHLAMATMLYLGARRSDVFRVGPPNESKNRETLTFTPWKGRKRSPKSLTLPILPPLRTILDASPLGITTYITTYSGQPYDNGDSFGNRFRFACREAGLPKCSPHGLRKIAAVRCAEAGATVFELMALFGWDDIKTAMVYIRKAQQKKMAANAGAKMMRSVPLTVPPIKKS